MTPAAPAFVTHGTRPTGDTGLATIGFDTVHGVLACAALAPGGTDLAPLLRREADALDAAALLESAETHQLRPAIAPAVAALAAGSGAWRLQAETLQGFARANQGRGRYMAGVLIEALDALDAAGVRAMPFKGPVFALRYANDPGAREMGDLDLIVATVDGRAASRALAAIGFAPPLEAQALERHDLARAGFELGFTREADAMLLELHLACAPLWYPAPCGVDDLFAQARREDFHGRAVRVPSPETLVLLHVADGMKSLGLGLRWIGDLAQLLRAHPALDWTALRAIAARRGGLDSVRVALALLAELGGTLAAWSGIDALRVDLPADACALAGQTPASPRLARARRAILGRLQADADLPGALAHFRWALQLSSRPFVTAGEIARYLCGPTHADLAQMPPQGESALALRVRALRRRVAGLARRGR